jgi:acyl-CoA thioesterase FadM
VVLLLRFIKAVVVSRLQRRVGPLDEASISMRAWPNDIDLNMHVTGSRYLGFMDVGRIALLARMRLLRATWKRGWRPIQGAAQITFRKSILPFERFVVRSRVICWDEKWFYFEHIVQRASGEIAAIGTVRGLFRGPDGNIDPQMFARLSGEDIDSPQMPEAVARFRATLTRE